MPPTIEYVTYIACTPERLWAALTNNEDLKKYWGDIQSTWTPNSEVKELSPKGEKYWRGDVVQVEPNKLLAYTFEAGSEEPPTTVTYSLHPPKAEIKDGQSVVCLKFTQTGFNEGSASYPEFAQAWPEILSTLKTYLETGTPLPFAWEKP